MYISEIISFLNENAEWVDFNYTRMLSCLAIPIKR
jgi:hypothetical protein